MYVMQVMYVMYTSLEHVTNVKPLSMKDVQMLLTLKLLNCIRVRYTSLEHVSIVIIMQCSCPVYIFGTCYYHAVTNVKLFTNVY